MKLSSKHNNIYKGGEITKPWLKQCMLKVKLGNDKNTKRNDHTEIQEMKNDFA